MTKAEAMGLLGVTQAEVDELHRRNTAARRLAAYSALLTELARRDESGVVEAARVALLEWEDRVQLALDYEKTQEDMG